MRYEAEKGIEKKFNEQDHKSLVLWATDCTEHVLPYFEEQYPKDHRPRKAIEAGRAWARNEMTMGEVRAAAFAAHSDARDTDNLRARAAARTAGHAAATVHVASHAPHAADYANSAAEDANGAKEHEWQYRHLTEHLRPIVFPEGNN